MKIDYMGIPMEVDYEFFKGEEQTYDYVGSPDYLGVTSVEVGGVEIIDLLAVAILTEIESEVLQKID